MTTLTATMISRDVEAQQRKRQIASSLRAVLQSPLEPNDPLSSPLVGPGPLTRMQIDAVSVTRLAHGKLHSYYPFSEVPTCWRRCFEEACLWQVLELLDSSDTDPGASKRDSLAKPELLVRKACDRQEMEDDIIRLCDDAIIVAGAPGRRDLINDVLSFVDEAWKDYSSVNKFDEEYAETNEHTRSNTDVHQVSLDGERFDLVSRPTKRPRLETDQLPPILANVVLPTKFPKSYLLKCSTLEQHLVSPTSRRSAPTLSEFEEHLGSHCPTPLVITDALKHWPAIQRWCNPRYWLHRTHSGRRRVPIEWGRSYVDEGWGQSIVPFGEYLCSELLSVEIDRETYTKDTSDQGCFQTPHERMKGKRKGYLAQHDLLNQIPSLRNDIAIPDYCYCSSKSISQTGHQIDVEKEGSDDMTEPALNLWLGPTGTVSPAHTDPHHNLLAQVFGRKYLRLFSPEMGPHMYPMSQDMESPSNETSKPESNLTGIEDGGYSMANTSSLDVGLEIPMLSALDSSVLPEEPDMYSRERRLLQRTRYPNFHKKAKYVECILEPGEMLFIPRGWWHYVRSLETSCSVSFWWD